LAQIVYARRALADLERLADFLLESAPTAAIQTIDLVLEAVEILENHPLIGRPTGTALRELVISRGKSAYLAPYSYEELQDTVLVLAVRHGREAGYSEE